MPRLKKEMSLARTNTRVIKRCILLGFLAIADKDNSHADAKNRGNGWKNQVLGRDPKRGDFLVAVFLEGRVLRRNDGVHCTGHIKPIVLHELACGQGTQDQNQSLVQGGVLDEVQDSIFPPSNRVERGGVSNQRAEIGSTGTLCSQMKLGLSEVNIYNGSRKALKGLPPVSTPAVEVQECHV
jgi:hypothetical protein